MPILAFDAQTRQANGKTYALFLLSGSLDEQKLEEIIEQIEPFLQSKHAYLVLDLGAVDLVSSHAMNYLSALHRKAAAAEKRIAFINANEELREILEFVGLEKFIAMFDAEVNFVDAMSRGEI
ncbi:MAG: STAS domain-containing protein [Patescibacteria group bacterium]